MQKVRQNTISLAVVLFSTLAAFGCKKSEQGETPLAGKLVTFDLPKNWVLQKHTLETDLETYQLLILDAMTDGTPDSANAGLSIEKVRDGLDVTNFATSHLLATSNPAGFAVLTNVFADDKWCSALSRGQQESTPYLLMDRFGVDHGVTVFFRVAQPIFSNDQVMAESISNFNAVVRSLKIAGTNSVNSEMRRDRGVIWLRSLSDMDTNWMTNEVVIRSPLPQK